MKKFLGCAAIYVCVTLLTAFGWIFFTRPGDTQSATIPPTTDDQFEMPAVTPPDSLAISNIVSGLLSTTAFQLDFNANIPAAKKSEMLTGELYLDFNRGLTKPVVQGSIVLQHNTLTLLYQYGWLYVTVFDGQYKISADSMLDVVHVITSFMEASQADPDQQATQFTGDLLQNMSSGLDLNQIMAELQNLTDEETEYGHIINLTLFDMGICLTTDLDYNLTQVTLDALTVDCTYLDELREFAVDAEEYTDLSALNVWTDAFLNTASLADWHLTGTVNVHLDRIPVIGEIDMNIPLDLRIKLVDHQPQIWAQVGPMPVVSAGFGLVSLNNDVPKKSGDYSSSLSLVDINEDANRILQIYYADGYVYFYRTEQVRMTLGRSRTYEKCWKITREEFLEDPMLLLSYGCGFTDLIMGEINKAMDLSKDRETPIDPNNVLLGLDVTAEELALLLNVQELANNPQLDTLSLSMFTTQFENKNYVGRAQMAVDMPLSDSFNLRMTCNDLTLVDINQPLDWTAFADFIREYDEKGQLDAQYEASNGKWEKTSEVVYTINFESNGGQTVPSITGPAGMTFAVPILETWFEDDGITHNTYTFVGWYTDPYYTETSLYTTGVITRQDLTLYALWDVTTQTYRKVVIINDKLQDNTISALPGTEFDLPTTFANIVEATDTERQVYAFEGWYTDAAFNNPWTGDNIVPDYDLYLYAKWVVVSNANYRTVKIVDTRYEDSPTFELVGLAGDALDLTSYASYYQTHIEDDKKTKQETYTFAGFDQNLTVFPEQDITIYVQWACETKYYYKVIFSNDTKNSRKMLTKEMDKKNIKGIPTEILYVLEGETVDLTGYMIPTWEDKYLFTNYYCDFLGWTTVCEGTDYITSLTVTGDTTIYAKWSDVKRK